MDIQELADPVPVPPRPGPRPEQFFKPYSVPASESPYATREDLGLSQSVLNKREVKQDAGLAPDSKLNIRYVKKAAPAPPGKIAVILVNICFTLCPSKRKIMLPLIWCCTFTFRFHK